MRPIELKLTIGENILIQKIVIDAAEGASLKIIERQTVRRILKISKSTST